MTDIKTLTKMINWKFFNYLKDRATEFEDRGYHITIDLVIKMNGLHYVLYTYENNQEFFNYKADKGYFATGNLSDLSYRIGCANTYILKEYYKSIENTVICEYDVTLPSSLYDIYINQKHK